MNDTQTPDTTQTTQTHDVPPPDANEAQFAARAGRIAEGLLETAVDLGSVWVRHGITVGKLALRTQSEWFGGLSKLLSQAADALEGKEPANEETDPLAH